MFYAMSNERSRSGCFPSSLEAIEDEMEHTEDEEDVHRVHQHLIGLLFGARAALSTVRDDDVDEVQVVDLVDL